jgi:uncharacterized protein (DUF924 family)
VSAIEPNDIIQFWLGVGEKKWYAVDPKLDAKIRERFEKLWREARDGKLSEWETSAEGSLGLLILTDQFPRNMFRGKADAFATDALARDVARRALARGYDMAFSSDARSFFYLPFMHSENISDQDFCVKLIGERLGMKSVNFPFALGHRDTILRFGRFPARNAALGRRSTEAEKAFIAKAQPH